MAQLITALKRWLSEFVARNIVAPDPHDPPYPEGFQMPQLHGVTVPESDMVNVKSMTCLLLAATPEHQQTEFVKHRAALAAARTLSQWKTELIVAGLTNRREPCHSAI